MSTTPCRADSYDGSCQKSYELAWHPCNKTLLRNLYFCPLSCGNTRGSEPLARQHFNHYSETTLHQQMHFQVRIIQSMKLSFSLFVFIYISGYLLHLCHKFCDDHSLNIEECAGNLQCVKTDVFANGDSSSYRLLDAKSRVFWRRLNRQTTCAV